MNRKEPAAITIRFEVAGRVQGVGYRSFVLRTAQDLGLHGWVCNRRDGSVEVLASGSRSSLRQLERRLHQGPLQSRVDEIIRHPDAGEPEGSGFSIVYQQG